MVKAIIFDIDGTVYSYEDAHAVAWEALCAYAKEHLDMDANTFTQCHKAAQTIVKERLGADVAALHNRQLRYQVLLEENNKKQLEKMMDMLNEIYCSGTKEATALVSVVFLGESIGDSEELLSVALSYMEEYKYLAVAVQNIFRKMKKGKSVSK